MATFSISGDNSSYTLRLSGMSTSTRYHVFVADLNSDGSISGYICRRSSLGTTSAWTYSGSSSSPYSTHPRPVMIRTTTAATSHQVGSKYSYDQVVSGTTYFDYQTIPAASRPTYTYKLQYNANGGTGAPSPQSYGPTTNTWHTFTVTLTQPTRSGYNFLGWSTSSTATTASYSPGDDCTVTNSSTTKTLYAVWQRLYTYTLKYNANGGSGAPATQTYGTTTLTSHTFTCSSTVPTRSGYQFLGWASSSTATTAEYTGGSNVSVTSSYTNQTRTLYAVWKQIATYTYYLVYNANGGSNAPSTQSYGPTTATSHSFTVTSSKPTRSGYNFLGWSSTQDGSASYQAGDSCSVLSSSTNQTRTLYAVWEQKQVQHKITLYYNITDTTTVFMTQSWIDSNDTIVNHALVGSSPSHTDSTHYSFIGWSLVSTPGSSIWKQPGDSVTFDAQNLSLYAHWEQTKFDHMITFFRNDGVTVETYFTRQSWIDTNQYIVNHQIVSSVPTHGSAGYEFIGWSLSPQQSLDPSAIFAYPGDTISYVSDTLILYALWRDISYEHKITYYRNDGITQETYYARQTWTDSNPGIINHTLLVSAPTHPDSEYYEFVGWSQQGSSVVYSPGEVVSIGKTNVDLYAQWRQVKFDHQIDLWYNDGSGRLFRSERWTDTNETIVGHQLTIAYPMHKDGVSEFIGWSLQASASAEVWKQPGDSVTFQALDLDLYAHWYFETLDKFYWTGSDANDYTNIAPNQPITNISASRWNTLNDLIQTFCMILNTTAYTYSRVDRGFQITDDRFNAVREGLSRIKTALGSSVSLPPTKNSGDTAYAYLFSPQRTGSHPQSIKGALNALIDEYNNRGGGS